MRNSWLIEAVITQLSTHTTYPSIKTLLALSHSPSQHIHLHPPTRIYLHAHFQPLVSAPHTLTPTYTPTPTYTLKPTHIHPHAHIPPYPHPHMYKSLTPGAEAECGFVNRPSDFSSQLLHHSLQLILVLTQLPHSQHLQPGQRFICRDQNNIQLETQRPNRYLHRDSLTVLDTFSALAPILTCRHFSRELGGKTGTGSSRCRSRSGCGRCRSSSWRSGRLFRKNTVLTLELKLLQEGNFMKLL